VGAADLGDRIVAVAEEDALVQLRRPLALGAVERAGALGHVGGELLEEEPAHGARVAGVAGEERALDRLREVDEGEDGAVEVGEVRGEEGLLLGAEGLDRVDHRRIVAVPGDAPRGAHRP
jgi:hypothetical protein